MQKPTLPIIIRILALVACAGLVAQFLAARSAFDLVTDNPAHGVAAALLIEATVVVEALVLMRSRSWPAALGLVVALLVSGTYNYVQAEAAQPAWGWWRLGTIAIGPLAALIGIGLALGEELRGHEERVAEWDAALQEQAAEEAAQLRQAEVLKRRRREERAVQRRRQAEADLQWKRRLERRRLDHELKETALGTRRQERWERKQAQAMAGQHDGDNRTATGQNGRGRSGVPRWPDKAAFLADTDRPNDLTDQQLAEMTGRTSRTARRWLAAVSDGAGGE